MPSQTYKQNLIGLIEQLKGMLPAEQLAVFNGDAQQLAKTHTTPLRLKAGDRAVNFELPDHKGNPVSLAELLSKGRVVVTFYRGVWCPYCNLYLKMFQDILPDIEKSGASFVAISPMTPDNSTGIVQQNELQYTVLSDIGNTIARQYTTVFRNGDAPIKAMSDLGYDFMGFYGDDSAEIPVPATFVIDTDGTILMAESAGGDYRERVEPQKVLDTLAQAEKIAETA